MGRDEHEHEEVRAHQERPASAGPLAEDWDYEFPEPADWAEGAGPYLAPFLHLHCPLADDGISRTGEPSWRNDDVERLMEELRYRGYGWLRAEGVRKKLLEMTAKWQPSPPLNIGAKEDGTVRDGEPGDDEQEFDIII